MRVIVCGSRNWTDGGRIERRLAQLPRGTTIVHGDARGADKIADAIARRLGFTVEAHPADWRGKGRAAGPARNIAMLAAGADLVIAFKYDFDATLTRGGTEHMVRIARQAGVDTEVWP